MQKERGKKKLFLTKNQWNILKTLVKLYENNLPKVILQGRRLSRDFFHLKRIGKSEIVTRIESAFSFLSLSTF